MKYVNSGEGKVPLITLIAILSISLTVNLPGLAISPILGKLDQVFHHVTELEVQLLTVLPNLVTIPFILCAGKICSQKNQIFVLGTGLVIYTLTGILYFFASSMTELIILSCLLGMGCGLVIPLAASLISQNFVGEARTKELGMKSSLSNFSIIFATLFVGWVAALDWHYSFFVYMVPIIPLVLIPFMTNKYIGKHRIIDSPASSSTPAEAATAAKPGVAAPVPAANVNSTSPRFTGKKAILLLVGIMVLYFLITYATDMVSYYLPFSMEHYHFSTDDVGVATSLYFAGMTLGGFLLTRVLAVLRKSTFQVALLLCIIGLFMVGFLHAYWSFIIGVFLMGFGYGVIQPVFYDKTSALAPTRQKNTAYFSYLLACNYVGIAVVPFIIGGAEKIFKAQNDPNFAAIFNGCVLVVMLVVAIIKCKSFVFEAESK
ncbi:MAG: MFS transporter [Muribaculaceae bacterium]|nr:MFS transporter [Muribaculaceae bacterium]